MKNNTIIKKVVEKYKGYGITESEVKLLINMAVSLEVPQEAIYPGIKMVLNNQYGINEPDLISDSMKALIADAMLTTMKNN